jgi:hypothetical protein
MHKDQGWQSVFFFFLFHNNILLCININGSGSRLAAYISFLQSILWRKFETHFYQTIVTFYKNSDGDCFVLALKESKSGILSFNFVPMSKKTGILWGSTTKSMWSRFCISYAALKIVDLTFTVPLDISPTFVQNRFWQ